ncbi:MAG: type II secretion system minor pseudopilin GspI [Pseudoxanthomonas sp.]
MKPHDRRPRTRRAAPSGFTLIEVLVAVAIVAVILIAGLQASMALGRQTQHQFDAIVAQWCAENALADLRLGHKMPDIGEESFTCEQVGHTLSGTLESRSTPNTNFRLIKVSMRDAQGGPILSMVAVAGNVP